MSMGRKENTSSMGEATALSAFLTAITSIVTQIVTWVTSVLSLYSADQPMLLFTVGFLAIGGAIGIIGRLLSRN